MARRIVKPMTDKEIASKAKQIGTHAEGRVTGLCLRVRKNKSGLSVCWMLRVQKDGKESIKSLGKYPIVSLAQARERASEYLSQFALGVNPFEIEKDKKEKQAEEKKAGIAKGLTLDDVLGEFMDYKQRMSWKDNEKTRNKEEKRLRDNLPSLLPIPLAEMTTEDVVEALRPIWVSKSATADRVQLNLKGCLEWAMHVKKCVPFGNNPADWNNLKYFLEPKDKRKKEQHMPALDPDQMPAFMKALHERAETHLTARCMEFAVLTCVRSANVREMRWEQLADDLSVWEIDAEDMKVTANGQHKVPLSKQAKEIIKTQKKLVFNSPWVFPSDRLPNRPLSNSALNVVIKDLHTIEVKAGREGWIDRKQTKELKTIRIAVQHGISRATFKTWAEGTRQDSRATELILHHEIDPRLKSAYDRSEDMEHKAKVLQNWANFCYSAINTKKRKKV